VVPLALLQFAPLVMFSGVLTSPVPPWPGLASVHTSGCLEPWGGVVDPGYVRARWVGDQRSRASIGQGAPLLSFSEAFKWRWA
jgi:hypothetical protein